MSISGGAEHTKSEPIEFGFACNGGAEGSRTPVRRPDEQTFSERSLYIDIPSAGLPQTGYRFQ